MGNHLPLFKMAKKEINKLKISVSLDKELVKWLKKTSKFPEWDNNLSKLVGFLLSESPLVQRRKK